MHASFVFDPNKCTGCQACQLACTIENDLTPGRSWRRIDTYNPRRHPAEPLFHLSLACNHCVQAPCQQGCPAAAYRRDHVTGALLLDSDRCIGCKYCAWICPYDAPVFDATEGVMTKCTLCNPRLQKGQPPACVELCPTGALGFTALPEAEIVQIVIGFPRTDAEPCVRIDPLARDGQPPQLTSPAPTTEFDARDDLPDTLISWRPEWSLVVFTLVTAVLVAAWTATRLGTLVLEPVSFGVTALAGLGFSALHLGQRRRAPRAVANLVQSWLSREALLVTLFLGLATIALAWPSREVMPGSDQNSQLIQKIGWFLAGMGFIALIAIDRVSRGVQRSDLPGWHSASTLLTGLYLVGILGHEPILATFIGLVKATLYIARKWALSRLGQTWRPIPSLVRISLGFVVPAGVWLLTTVNLGNPEGAGVISAGSAATLVLTGVLMAELVDRCEYYAELEVTTPKRQMALDLARRTST
jgi:Fe-S-cluster-containing dehydrogenase component